MSDQRDTGSLLGSGSEFNGKLSFFGTVRIEGSFRGEIISDDTLVVADGAEVRGEINVGTLIVTGGVVEANVTAKNSVELQPPGKLVGEVNSPVFQIERGAIFRGNCSMPDAEETDEEE